MEPLDELLLIRRVLRRQPKDFGSRRAHLGVMVAKSARFRGASPSARDEIPVVDEWRLARPAGSRIRVYDNSASVDRRQRDLAAICSGKRDIRNARIKKVIRRAVVDWRGKIRGKSHRIVNFFGHVL